MSRILITRSLIEALPLSEALESRGLSTFVAPLFEPQFFPVPSLTHPQALLITSKNALRAIENEDHLKNIPLYGVGDETTFLAKKFGFKKAMSSSGTAQELIELVKRNEALHQGILYHLSGEHIKIDIVKALQAEGFRAKREVIYFLKKSNTLSESLIKELRDQSLSHVMFFSAATAQTFIHLLKKNDLGFTSSFMVALCLSHDVAKSIQSLKWKEIWISQQPNIMEIIGYFDDK